MRSLVGLTLAVSASYWVCLTCVVSVTEWVALETLEWLMDSSYSYSTVAGVSDRHIAWDRVAGMYCTMAPIGRR